MLHAVKVKPDVYWVGGIDWNERNFHGYTTDRGSTYNAYLIMDEQVTLIDTCKPAFAGELIERISEVVDPACIEHVAYCAVFATPFHAPLLQRSMADCHVAMRVALIARGAQAPLLANTAGYALSRCACALTRRLQYG